MFIELKDHNNHTISLNINQIVTVKNWTDSKDYRCVIRTQGGGIVFSQTPYSEILQRIASRQKLK